MNEPSTNPFDATDATWASPLEQLLSVQDLAPQTIDPMAAGSSVGVAAVPETTFTEAVDTSQMSQLTTEFDTQSVPDSELASAESVPVTTMTADEHAPVIDSVDQMFDMQQDPSLHDQVFTDDHISGIQPEHLDSHDAAVPLDAGGFTDPFALG